MEMLRERGYAVATELLPASAFYPAEAYHQGLRPARAEAAAISACPVSGYEQKNKEPSVSPPKRRSERLLNHFIMQLHAIKKLIQIESALKIWWS